jgi:hypothetical protein
MLYDPATKKEMTAATPKKEIKFNNLLIDFIRNLKKKRKDLGMKFTNLFLS